MFTISAEGDKKCENEELHSSKTKAYFIRLLIVNHRSLEESKGRFHAEAIAMLVETIAVLFL